MAILISDYFFLFFIWPQFFFICFISEYHILLQSAIGSVAAAAEQAFIPYAEKVLEMMKSFMVLTDDEDLRARARATELVGIVAMAVGRTRMEPILPPFIEAALSVSYTSTFIFLLYSLNHKFFKCKFYDFPVQGFCTGL